MTRKKTTVPAEGDAQVTPAVPAATPQEQPTPTPVSTSSKPGVYRTASGATLIRK